MISPRGNGHLVRRPRAIEPRFGFFLPSFFLFLPRKSNTKKSPQNSFQPHENDISAAAEMTNSRATEWRLPDDERCGEELQREISTIYRPPRSLSQVDELAHENASQLLRDEVEDLKRQLLSEASQRRILERQVLSLKQDLSQQSELYDKNRQLLDMRTTELNGFQSLFTTVDALAVSDVIRMVDILNSEILQTAALVSETETSKSRLVLGRGEHGEEQSMPVLIQGVPCQIDRETRVQASLQARLVAYCSSEIGSWSNQGWIDKLLDEAYRNIEESEPPAVTAKWRALTHSQIKAHVRTEDVSSELLRTIIDTLIDVGCLFFEDMLTMEDTVKRGYWGRLMAIAKMIQKVDRAITEGITSQHLAIRAAQNGQLFRLENHADAYADPGSETSYPSARILCCTDMGIENIQMVAQGDRRERRVDVLLKPKVILQAEFLQSL
ncbi:hypothetical protein C8J56DRAFT_898412 [Mycena floridula]|nr:hypothetical protein C8J56DRAFT_898412 [Mycena floridula]